MEVQPQGDTGRVVYLPHKKVVKEGRSVTKLGIVFDASAKYKDTMLLNDVLYKGPCLNANLYSLLLKFRVHPIVLTADIEKAYLKININEEHRDYSRFLWYGNLKEESIIRYRFTRVIFCVASSEFLLNGTVQTHAKKYENIDPEFVRKVKKHFYVDNLNSGAKRTERLNKNQDSVLHRSLTSLKTRKPNKEISEKKINKKNQKNPTITLSERGKMAILVLFWQFLPNLCKHFKTN